MKIPKRRKDSYLKYINNGYILEEAKQIVR